MYKENDIVYFLERQSYNYSTETFKEIIPYDDLLFSVIKMKVVNEEGILKVRSLEKIYIPINHTKRFLYDGFPLERMSRIASMVLFNSKKEAKQYYYEEHKESKQYVIAKKERMVSFFKTILDDSLSMEEKIESIKKVYSDKFEKYIDLNDDKRLEKAINVMKRSKTF